MIRIKNLFKFHKLKKLKTSVKNCMEIFQNRTEFFQQLGWDEISLNTNSKNA